MNPTVKQIKDTILRLQTALLREYELDEVIEKVGREKRAAHQETMLARDELNSIRFY